MNESDFLSPEDIKRVSYHALHESYPNRFFVCSVSTPKTHAFNSAEEIDRLNLFEALPKL